MKKLIFSHILLNIALLVIIQPALPVLEYLIHYDYIANELCENKDLPVSSCHGKCYLGDQVEKQLDVQTGSESPQPPLTDFQKFIGAEIKFVLKKNFVELKSIQRFDHDSSLHESLFALGLLRPPQA